MNSRTLDKTSLYDIFDGAMLLAGGGGGPVQAGLSILHSIVVSGKYPRLMKLQDLPDSAHVAVPIAVGSAATLLEDFLDFQMLRAFEIFRKMVGGVDAVVALEAGHINVIEVLYVAAKMGVPVIDADGTGRAIPEFRNTVFYSTRVDPNPFVMVDSAGNEVILNASSVDDVDRLSRTICTEMGSQAGTTAVNMTGSVVKKIIVPETLSRCEKLGRVLRENAGKDPVSALVRESGGFLVIEGLIAEIQSKVRHGHDYGNLIIRGFGKHDGKTARVAFKNEGLVTYLNERPVVISPDHVFVLDLVTHRPVLFTDAVEDLAVAVVALRVPQQRRTPADYDGFRASLHDVGYDGEYVPVENLLGE